MLASNSARSYTTQRVLIVDDHPYSALMLAQALRPFRQPVEVLTAHDGGEAWRVIEQGTVDVLITDYLMPSLNGLELITRLRDQHATTQTILVTAHHTPSLAAAARDLQVANYLVKPISPEKIRQAVEDALEHHLPETPHPKTVERTRTEWLAMASHELKSPLTTILAYSDLLKRAGPLTERQVEYVARIQAVTRRMNELVRSLVEQAQADWQAASRWEVCVLPLLAREVADELLPAATAQDLTLRVKLPDTPIYVWGDASRLRQAIRNLLSNAIKYTPAHGQVTLALEERGAEACLSVTDTGLGIAPADLPLIFERFYRVRTTDRLDIEGSGLGLSIVKTIVEQHNGQVAVESDLGQGSCFRFSLPLFSARPASPPIA